MLAKRSRDAMLRWTNADSRTRPPAFAASFPTFVSEMGRQNEKLARRFCKPNFDRLCDAENRFDHKALSSDCLLRVLRRIRRSHA
jgi:hypothetical protein